MHNCMRFDVIIIREQYDHTSQYWTVIDQARVARESFCPKQYYLREARATSQPKNKNKTKTNTKPTKTKTSKESDGPESNQ